MATAKEHLKKLHKTIAAHHKAMSKAHGHALQDEDLSDHQQQFHKAAQTAHDEAAEEHDQMCEECSKGADVTDLAKATPSALEAAVRETFLKMFGDTVMPSKVSTIAGEVPFGIRAIPRAGQRSIPETATPAVAMEFSKLFSMGEEPLSQ